MKSESGFGLLEMMIAMAVLGVLVGGAFGVLFRSQVTFELQQADRDVRQQARVSLDVLTTEARLAGYRMGNLTEPVTRAGADVLQFVGNIDDGAVAMPCGAAFENATNGGAERVTYERTSGQLLRTVDCWDGSSWSTEYQDEVMATNLLGDQALFHFFDADGTEITAAGTELSSAQRADVRTVAVALRLLDSRTLADGKQAAFDLSGRIYLPNVN